MSSASKLFANQTKKSSGYCHCLVLLFLYFQFETTESVDGKPRYTIHLDVVDRGEAPQADMQGVSSFSLPAVCVLRPEEVNYISSFAPIVFHSFPFRPCPPSILFSPAFLKLSFHLTLLFQVDSVHDLMVNVLSSLGVSIGGGGMGRGGLRGLRGSGGAQDRGGFGSGRGAQDRRGFLGGQDNIGRDRPLKQPHRQEF